MNEKFQEKLLQFFTDKELLRNVRSITVLTLILALPIWYFAFNETLTIDSLINWKFGAIVILVTISVTMATKESKIRAFEDNMLTNDDLVELQEKTEKQSKDIKHKDPRSKRSINFIKQYNNDKQSSYNDILTNKEIERLERKALQYRLNDKQSRAVKCETKIAHLKQNPLFDKHFEPYDLRNIIMIQKSLSKVPKKKGNNEINDDPTSLNWVVTFLSMLLRSAGVGIFGSIPIMFSESFKAIVLFYLSYLIILAFTIISQYMLTTWKMENKFKIGLETIDLIQTELLDYLEKPIEEAQEQETCPIEELTTTVNYDYPIELKKAT